MTERLQVGDIAMCKAKRVGIIFDFDETRKAYVGKTIYPLADFGRPWQSKRPRRVTSFVLLTALTGKNP